MKGKRYVRKKGGEANFTRNVREMIEMMKNEKVNEGDIDFGKLQMTYHATERIMEYSDCKHHEALKVVTEILKKAERVGEQLAYDGRINVMFSYDQYAIYLSPNLEYVVTVHKFERMSYEPVCKKLEAIKKKHKGKHLRNKLIQLHKYAWEKAEQEEAEQTEVVMGVYNEIIRLESLLEGYSPKHYKKYIKARKAEEDKNLITEGEKLFSIKLEKRHIGKSITSLLLTNAQINSK